MKVLFVCTGNICRSPMAEVIFANICENAGRTDIVIKGAGTGAFAGEEMTPEAREALITCGEKVAPNPRPSTRWDNKMIKKFDHIICMTNRHVHTIDPKGKHKNVYTLDSATGCGEVLDPWSGSLSIYIEVCRQLQSALKTLFEKITNDSV